MNICELKNHLENECINTEFECNVCGQIEVRASIT
jgi:hypothetical protein